MRFSLDTKLVLLGSVMLWGIGFLTYFLAGYIAGGGQDGIGFGTSSGDSDFPLRQRQDCRFHHS